VLLPQREFPPTIVLDAPGARARPWPSLTYSTCARSKLYLSLTSPYTALPGGITGTGLKLSTRIFEQSQPKVTLDHGIADTIAAQPSSRINTRDRRLLASGWHLGTQILAPNLELFFTSCTATPKSNLDTLRSPCGSQLPCKPNTSPNPSAMHFVQIGLSHQVVPIIEQPSLRTAFVRSRGRGHRGRRATTKTLRMARWPFGKNRSYRTRWQE
jgi:hypothetical protein